MGLFVTVHDASTTEVVRTHLYRHFISRQNSDVILPHLAGDVRNDTVVVFEPYAKHRVRKRFFDRTVLLNYPLLCHMILNSERKGTNILVILKALTL